MQTQDFLCPRDVCRRHLVQLGERFEIQGPSLGDGVQRNLIRPRSANLPTQERMQFKWNHLALLDLPPVVDADTYGRWCPFPRARSMVTQSRATNDCLGRLTQPGSHACVKPRGRCRAGAVMAVLQRPMPHSPMPRITAP